jgi:hypothetical protein
MRGRITGTVSGVRGSSINMRGSSRFGLVQHHGLRDCCCLVGLCSRCMLPSEFIAYCRYEKVIEGFERIDPDGKYI